MEKSNERKKCELLVPAGGVKQFIAAVENGADAIYVGGKEFNARINAGNFNNEQMKQAIDFAHLRGVKVYVTMNTLVTDDELALALDYAKTLYTMGTDALIIQDLGLARIIRGALPDFPLHLSTQATVYSPAGVKASAELGFERVVLARELSAEEIGACVKAGEECRQPDGASTEIEVFIHGALCICYSGQCQMSRYMGGRSGNRGQCAQPCRLPYKVLDESGRAADTFKYPLSPKDLCMIDYLGDYVDMGVASLKIEGRMKSPEYVAIVTQLYRKYLDMYYAGGSYVVSSEDRIALEQIFNRGGFTQGYFKDNPGDELMSGELPKHRGVKIGKVVKPVSGTALLDCKLYDELSLGDGVEIHNKTLSGNIVTYLLPLKGGLTRIGDIKGKFQHGDEIYRISSKNQLKEAQTSFEFVDFQEGKYKRKTPIIMKLEAHIGEPLKLTVNTHAEQSFTQCEVLVWNPEIIAEKPIKSATDHEQIDKQLRKTGNTPFEVKEVQINEQEPFAISVGSLNSLRRQAVEALKDKMIWGRTLPDLSSFDNDNMKQSFSEDDTLEFYFYDYETFAQYKELLLNITKNGKFRALLPVEDYINNIDRFQRLEVWPYISNMPKGQEDLYLTNNFDDIVKVLKEEDSSIYVGNIGWTTAFSNSGVMVYGDFGLNIYNEEALRAYSELGVTCGVSSLEDDTTYVGAAPLMVSEHKVDGTYLVDRKGKHLNLLDKYHKTVVLRDVDNIRIDDLNSKGIKRVYVVKGTL